MNPMPTTIRTALDGDAAYRALLARDARLDGRLFVGVTSTGIYCRPICRVRTPRRENCRFFETPAQAEAAAFRPCLKCRPEIAPGAGFAWSVMDASRTLAQQAAQLLAAHADASGFDGAADSAADSAADDAAASVAALARRLGVSDRHLRRIFAAEHGVTPQQYLQTRRLLLAKQLLTDSDLPVAQVAFASGFRSVRRFNAAFADNYRLSPSRLRREATSAAPAPSDGVCATLAFREPLDHAALLRFLAKRAIPGVEHVDVLRVRRSVRGGLFGEHAGWVEVEFLPTRSSSQSTPRSRSRQSSQPASRSAPRPHVRLRCSPSLALGAGGLIAAVRRWLDLDADPAAIDAALADLPGSPGLRLPGGIDAFELVVRAILGQQVTVAAARTLAGRLVDRFGDAIETPWAEVQRAFPAPDALATAGPPSSDDTDPVVAELGALGIIRSRGTAIVAVARAWPELVPLVQPHASPQALIERLRAIPGIGPWTAAYVTMRALGWADAFPPGDVAVLNAMGLPRGTRAEREADQRSQAWRPWRAYAVLKLWNSLEPTS